MVEVWTLEQDEELRAACERAGGDLSLKKVKWWEELARGFPGSNAKTLQQVSARAPYIQHVQSRCAPKMLRACAPTTRGVAYF